MSRSDTQVTSISKARTLDEIADLWDMHSSYPSPGLAGIGWLTSQRSVAKDLAVRGMAWHNVAVDLLSVLRETR